MEWLGREPRTVVAYTTADGPCAALRNEQGSKILYFIIGYES
jgi:hypothetical protein